MQGTIPQLDIRDQTSPVTSPVTIPPYDPEITTAPTTEKRSGNQPFEDHGSQFIERGKDKWLDALMGLHVQKKKTEDGVLKRRKGHQPPDLAPRKRLLQNRAGRPPRHPAWQTQLNDRPELDGGGNRNRE